MENQNVSCAITVIEPKKAHVIINSLFFADLNLKYFFILLNASLNRVDIIKNISILDNIFSKYIFAPSFSDHLKLTLRKFQSFIDEIEPVLEGCGIEFRQPPEFEREIEIKLLLNNTSREVSSSLTLEDLVDFDWKIALGDKEFTINEFKRVSNNFKGLIKIKDKFYRISKDNLTRLQKDINKIPKKKDTSSMLSYILGSASDNVVIDEN